MDSLSIGPITKLPIGEFNWNDTKRILTTKRHFVEYPGGKQQVFGFGRVYSITVIGKDREVTFVFDNCDVVGGYWAWKHYAPTTIENVENCVDDIRLYIMSSTKDGRSR